MHCKPHLGPAFSLALCALWLAATGCKRRPPEEAVPSATAPLASAAPPAPRCSAAAPGKAFTVGERSAPAPESPEVDDGEGPTDEPGLPFAIELGSAVATADGFAVAGLSTKAAKTTAIVVLVDADAGRGQLVELGRLHGDSDPPELASQGDDLFALVHDTDAGGELLRLVALRRGPKKVDAVIGAEIAESRDESRVARIALGKERGVAIWDGWHKAAKHGVIRVATFAKNDVSVVTRPRVVSPASEDAEMPSLVPRPGGFWAAWITRTVERDGKVEKGGRPAPAPSGAPTGDPTLVEMGARYVTVVPLDENGSPMSEPKAVSSKNEHVLVFDLAPGPDGTAWVAWRDEATAPGAEERLVHVARVKADGSVEKEAFEDEQVGVGVPSLLVDARPPGGSSTPWISLGSVSDETRLAALGPAGRPADTLAMEPEVRSAEPLVLARGRMLIARPKGLAVELSVVECKPGPAP